MKNFKAAIIIVALIWGSSVQGAIINTSRSNLKHIATVGGEWCLMVTKYNYRTISTTHVELTALKGGEDCDDKNEISRLTEDVSVELNFKLELDRKSTSIDWSQGQLAEQVSSVRLVDDALDVAQSELSLPDKKQANPGIIVPSPEEGKKLYVGNLPYSATDNARVITLPAAANEVIETARKSGSVIYLTLRTRTGIRNVRVIVDDIRK